MTFDEYFASVLGKGIDFDGNYGVQCFDLANDYAVKVLGCKPFIGLYAYEIYTNFAAQPSAARFTRIPNTPDFVPLKGDIMVWSKTLNDTAGHVAICTGEGDTSWFKSYDQNWTGLNDKCTKVQHTYNNVLGVLRPKEQTNLKSKTTSLKIFGIDVSRYQGRPIYENLKKNVGFVIAQIGFGKYDYQVDDQFRYNYDQAHKYDIPFGGYWYSYATNADDAKQEAECCLRVIKGLKFEYPIYIDIEENINGMTTSTVSSIAETFCSTLEKAGYYAGIYMSRSPAQAKLSTKIVDKYALWLAEYGSKLNWSGPDVGIWQYGSVGRVSGITGDVDTDYCYVDYPSIIKNAGLNGYAKPTVNTLDTKGFQQGDKNDGVLAYKQLLILAHNLKIIDQKVDNNNSFGTGTTKATNKFLALLGKNQNGIAGANIIKALGEKIKEVVTK